MYLIYLFYFIILHLGKEPLKNISLKDKKLLPGSILQLRVIQLKFHFFHRLLHLSDCAKLRVHVRIDLLHGTAQQVPLLSDTSKVCGLESIIEVVNFVFMFLLLGLQLTQLNVVLQVSLDTILMNIKIIYR